MILQFYQNDIVNVLNNVKNVIVFDDGATKKLQQEEQEKCLQNLSNIFQNAFVMPALGVSLHNETLEALKNGKWIRLEFQNQQDFNGLVFSALLFKLEETGGVNLIREINDKYEGRCIYLNFDKTINLKNILNNI